MKREITEPNLPPLPVSSGNFINMELILLSVIFFTFLVKLNKQSNCSQETAKNWNLQASCQESRDLTTQLIFPSSCHVTVCLTYRGHVTAIYESNFRTMFQCNKQWTVEQPTSFKLEFIFLIFLCVFKIKSSLNTKSNVLILILSNCFIPF